jgi:hypothetical protein
MSTPIPDDLRPALTVLCRTICNEYGQENPLVPGLRLRIMKRIEEWAGDHLAERIARADAHEGGDDGKT